MSTIQDSVNSAPRMPQVKRAEVPLQLEEIGLPMNTYGPKNPFTGAWVGGCGWVGAGLGALPLMVLG